MVLSARDTGRGDVRAGEGAYGLRRAFLLAGVETLVMSLWKVDDVATGELMSAYYHHLLAGEGEGQIDALRRAAADVRIRRRHPYYWAAFIAIGSNEPIAGFVSAR